jgi:hypothetical protein
VEEVNEIYVSPFASKRTTGNQSNKITNTKSNRLYTIPNISNLGDMLNRKIPILSKDQKNVASHFYLEENRLTSPPNTERKMKLAFMESGKTFKNRPISAPSYIKNKIY